MPKQGLVLVEFTEARKQGVIGEKTLLTSRTLDSEE